MRACEEEAVAECEAGSAACGHCVYVQLWGLDRDSGGGGFVDDFVSTIEARHIG